MSIDSSVSAPQDVQPVPVGTDPVASEVEELLVEEVSIDGMCGVY
ncbi:MAG TPA: mycofactocin precursor MftA [Kineosporiaceae bacterium]|nr:mycofactocin precursor MftA [Kineosporiaceae bacterium]